MKKSIAIIIGLAIILGAVAAYFFFKSTPSAPVAVNPATGLPFGSGDGYDVNGNPIGSSTTTATTIGANGALPTLFQITSLPVAGAVSILKDNAEVIRYAERATGHVYDVDLSNFQSTEISNTTLPKIYAAVWSADGGQAVFRSLIDETDTGTSLNVTLTTPKATSTILYTISTAPVRGSFGDLIATADGKLAYESYDQKAIATSNFDGTKPLSLYASAFTDWRVMGSTKTSVIVATKASAGGDGFAYSVSRSSGGLTKLLGPLPGLVVLPNTDGSRLAFSTSDGTNTTLSATVLKTGASESLAPATLAEKCAWSAKQASVLYCASPTGGVDAGEPDLWYRGQAHFADRIWRFNVDTGAARLLASPSTDLGKDIDAENLVLSPDEDYLIFMNRSDLSLWALKLN